MGNFHKKKNFHLLVVLMSTFQSTLWILLSCLLLLGHITNSQSNSINTTQTTTTMQPPFFKNTTIYLESTSIQTTNQQQNEKSFFEENDWFYLALIGAGFMMICVCIMVILCKKNKNESNENLETHHNVVSTKDDLEMTKLQKNTKQEDENGDAAHVESPLINPFDDDDNRRARMSTIGKDIENPFLMDGALEIDDGDIGPSTVEQKKNWIAFDEE